MIRKKTLGVILFSLITLTLAAQQNVSYNFLTPQANKKVSTHHYELLIDKVKQFYDGNVLFSNQTPFTLLPVITILDEKNAAVVDQSMLLKVEVQLLIKNTDIDVTFNTYRKTFTALGENYNQAIVKAINQVKFNDPILQNFFVVANSNINKFYKENCSKIISSAKVNVARKEFSRAFNFLKYVPEDISCFKEVEDLMTQIYIDNKDENCKKLLQKAHISESKEHYTKALEYLKYVDPVSSCYKDVTALLNQIGKKVNVESFQEFEMEKLKFSKLSDFKKMQLLVENVDFLSVTVNN